MQLKPTVVVIDGPDGAGKTTLVRALLAMGQKSKHVVAAPRLGEFLPCGDDGARFAAWITACPTCEVNSLMLAASSKRTKVAVGLARSGIVLLDRGPVTVFASCIARVMRRNGLTAEESEKQLLALISEHQLYPVPNELLLPVLCYVPDVETILRRCAMEVADLSYRSYLIALHSILRPSWSRLEGHLVLPANESPEANASSVFQKLA